MSIFAVLGWLIFILSVVCLIRPKLIRWGNRKYTMIAMTIYGVMWLVLSVAYTFSGGASSANSSNTPAGSSSLNASAGTYQQSQTSQQSQSAPIGVSLTDFESNYNHFASNLNAPTITATSAKTVGSQTAITLTLDSNIKIVANERSDQITGFILIGHDNGANQTADDILNAMQAVILATNPSITKDEFNSALEELGLNGGNGSGVPPSAIENGIKYQLIGTGNGGITLWVLSNNT